jgi:putative transposase
MRRESHVRFCERFKVKFLGPTHQVNGAWKDLYRAVDKEGQTVDFLLTATRDADAARRFFDKAMRHNAVPDKVTMDKSGANHAALEQLNKEREVPITIRQVKYLNNIVEQDHESSQNRRHC